MTSYRRGYLIIELVAAAFLLSTLMVVVLHLFIQTAAWRRESQDRALAAAVAGNLLERCVSLPRPEITQEKLTQLATAEQDERLLRDETVKIELGEIGADQQGRIAVEVGWKTAIGNPQGPVRLTTWIYDHKPKDSQ